MDEKPRDVLRDMARAVAGELPCRCEERRGPHGARWRQLPHLGACPAFHRPAVEEAAYAALKRVCTEGGSRANPFIRPGERVRWEDEAMALATEIARLKDRDPVEVFAEGAHYHGAQLQKVNPAALTEDRLVNTVLDLRATLKTLKAREAKR